MTATTTKARRSALAGLLAIILPLAWAVPSALVNSDTETVVKFKATETCAEDDPCWDCETMGNGLCGPKDRA